MSIRVKLTAAAVVLVSTLTYVVVLGASSSWQYYVTVDECIAHPEGYVGSKVRISGRVARESLVIDDGRSLATFKLCGTNGSVNAVCPRPLPDNLAEDMDVVVEGSLDGPSSVRGVKVLTRCASKYASQ
jgi:cytochrome c-type biogenesis protein CcmE